jgi:hypothetical protein
VIELLRDRSVTDRLRAEVQLGVDVYAAARSALQTVSKAHGELVDPPLTAVAHHAREIALPDGRTLAIPRELVTPLRRQRAHTLLAGGGDTGRLLTGTVGILQTMDQPTPRRVGPSLSVAPPRMIGCRRLWRRCVRDGIFESARSWSA